MCNSFHREFLISVPGMYINIFFIDQAVGFPLSVTIQSISTVVLGMIIAFSTSVKLAAVCSVAFVLMVAIVIIESR